MRHGVKKIKFSNGIDANRALTRKLAVNFFLKGKLSTTLSKAKAMKPVIERLIEKMKVKTESNLNYLKQKLDSKEVIEMAYKDISPTIAKINGGYVRVIKLGQRESDGAETARIEWVYPIIKQK
ncbi:50S ribosomal protein L17 [Candidatus Roizmanbacteria bacterium CG_4_9_14_3_um_filter_33_18]|uniref:50S ribosomal protein L17 n=3 Tax=Candidatus Roizmaniibacteriota TaxID=1752723 RepID=A0A2M7U8I6_9BACT|nr:MAG: 50S ribosomal protein L17 [Candidatus Roizmanbacteria bacterium CG22_combo_CG10-13_8_21_14_all_34_12]PIZ67550.1 MAG: 50S ribosomal protein L17 [Candidatus Roizmanbacteria bacterium CG_4_10_14_0_2_um_filter_33_96]PJA55458.1 MAG: 50S ribosomal protein L17 [Candidatus Roizmanbacteria bacterium CG_4_9_14_3_um_filter_33_18]